MSTLNYCFFLALFLASTNAFMHSSVRRIAREVSSLSMSDRKPFMGGNWKLNPGSISEAKALASGLAKLVGDNKDVDICVFPPFPFLVPVAESVTGTNIKLGGQDSYLESNGAYTGAVSTGMLKSVGANYVLCGHSERRAIFGDTDTIINKKVKKVLAEGLTPVLCFGETKMEYEAGLNKEICAVQLLEGLIDVSAEDMAKIVLAYEPVWAIGTGLVCPSDLAQRVHAYIRSTISRKYGASVADQVIIQYGGSVKPDNVKELMAMPDIDGCLVGGASLTADSFAKICNFNI